MGRIRLICLVLLGVMACQKDRKSQVDSYIEEFNKRRVEVFKEEQFKLCRENVLKEAEDIVDSLLQESPVLIPVDSIKKPPRPKKPHAPDFQLPVDSLVTWPAEKF